MNFIQVALEGDEKVAPKNKGLDEVTFLYPVRDIKHVRFHKIHRGTDWVPELTLSIAGYEKPIMVTGSQAENIFAGLQKLAIR